MTRRMFGYSALMLIGSGALFLRSMLFAKVLPVETFGYLGLFMLVGQYGAVLFNLGMLNGLNREYPVLLGAGDERRAVHLRNVVLSGVAGAVALGAIPYTLGVLWWAREAEWRAVLFAGYLVASLTVLYQLACLELRSRQQLLEFAIAFLLQSITTLLLGVAGGWAWGLPGAIGAVIIGYAGTTVLAWAKWLPKPTVVRVTWSDVAPLLDIGVPLLMAGFCVTLVQSMDRFFVVGSHGVESFGHYQFGAIVLIGGQTLAGVVAQWISPQVLHAHGRGVGPLENVRRLLALMSGIIALFAATAFPLHLGGEWAVGRFFPRYADAVPLLVPFWIASGFMVANLSGVILNALNRQRLLLASTLVPAVVLLGAYAFGAAHNLPLVGYAWLAASGQAVLTLVHAGLAYCYARDSETIPGSSPVLTSR